MLETPGQNPADKLCVGYLLPLPMSLDAMGKGGIKQAANVLGNLKDFPKIIVLFWVGVIY